MAKWVLLGALVVACGCGKTTCPDPLGEELSRDELLRAQRGAERDAAFCSDLLTPRMKQKGDELVLGGAKEHVLARRSVLPEGEIARVEPIRRGVAAHRELCHPGKDFDGEIDISLEPGLDAARALSAVLSASEGGFGRVHLVAGASGLRATLYQPSRIGSESYERIVVVTDDGDVGVQVLGGEHCDRKERLRSDRAAVSATVARACREAGEWRSVKFEERPEVSRYADLVEIRVRPTAHFGDVLALARSALEGVPEQGARPHLALRLAGTAPPDPNAPFASIRYTPSDRFRHCL
jgi:hypothetical protein